VKLRWVAVSVLVAAAALAAGWGMGLFKTQASPPDVTSAPAPAPSLAKKEAVAPLRTAALMLAHARPTPSPIQRLDPPSNDPTCGASGVYCDEDAVCVDGGCVSTVCAADGGPGVRCALPNGTIGACCGERCSDLDRDGANCGQCGLACLNRLDCVSGRCQARTCAGRMAGTPCANAGSESGACCRGACINRSAWASDAANCGGCGHACAPGLTCRQGSCIDPGTGTPPSWTCLDEGHTCAEDSFCVVDACFPRACSGDNDGMLCPEPAGERLLGHCCGPVCADLFADRNNCRACGVRCSPGEVCKNGDCASPDP
jgi:hypothetical protein